MLEFIKIAAIICQTSAIENSKGKWSKLEEAQLATKQCIVTLIDCSEKNGGLTDYNLLKCLKEDTKL